MGDSKSRVSAGLVGRKAEASCLNVDTWKSDGLLNPNIPQILPISRTIVHTKSLQPILERKDVALIGVQTITNPSRSASYGVRVSSVL